jgi:DNA adenine methylase
MASNRLSAFPYPGGKTSYIDDILQYFPEHRRYVEVFGGGAAILLNKPESYIEVYNDRDSDVVQFFRVVRERRRDLEAWLRKTPFSRELHSRWCREFFNGHRPEDPIERAGRWFYLRYTQYGGKINGPSGFKASGKRNEARSYRGGIDALDEVAERFAEVTLENEDFESIIQRYDATDTLFYCDPPYIGPGDTIYDTEFDHRRLANTLAECDGDWVCSYGDFPRPLVANAIGATRRGDAWTATDFGASYSLHYTVDEGRRDATEQLMMNFDPTTTPTFSGAEQSTLAEVGDG